MHRFLSTRELLKCGLGVPSETERSTAIKISQHVEPRFRAQVLERYRQLAAPVGMLAIGGAGQIDRAVPLYPKLIDQLQRNRLIAGDKGFADAFRAAISITK